MEDKKAYQVYKTDTLSNWLDGLRDSRTRARILTRLERIEDGNFSNSAPVGEGVSEIKMDFGPGYRLYYTMIGSRVVLLLCGGDKSSQTLDIRLAKRMKKEVENGSHNQ